MLVRINATINNTSEQSRAINFLRCIRAVCTATAGSTPSVQPLTAPSTFGAGDCIVEVISNAEAGGWTESSTTTFTTVPTVSITGSQWTTAYNAAYAGVYFLDLYNSTTGKTTYPYYKQTFSTNMYSTGYFSASYTTYPNIDWSTGFHTATTLDGNYRDGLINNTTGSWTCRNFTLNQGNTSYANASTNTSGLRPNAGEFLIASTSQYIIIIGASGIFYWGNRSNAQWENAYTNNPYLAAFAYHCNGTGATSPTSSVIGLYDTLLTYGYSIDNTGTISAAPSWKQGNSQASITPNPIGGSGITATQNYASYYHYGNSPTSGYVVPIMPFGLRSNNGTTMVGPSTDSSTGANVPPAYPIVVSHTGGTNNLNQTNAIAGIAANTGMVLPGLYRSLAGSDSFMNQFYTAGTTYVVGTENYYPYTVGQNASFKDLFLIRKY